MTFEDIMDLINNDYDCVLDEIDLKFRFNVKGVINTLFYGVYEKYNQSLKQIATLISCEILYGNLYVDFFNNLYTVPLHENRFNDLGISSQLFRICSPIFEFINDKNFGLIIYDIFDNLLYCIVYILTQTKHVNTKQWIKNDYGLIRDDINDVVTSFEDDINKEYIEERTVRVYHILEMIKHSTTHLTQHELPLLQDYIAYCENEHVLHECLIHPHQLLNDTESTIDKEEENENIAKVIRLIKCKHCRLYINVKHRIEEIGYYCCGYEQCLKQNIFYCGHCCNKMMYEQNINGNVSKWDIISMLNKKKNEEHSKQFAMKYIQNQSIRSQVTMTVKQKAYRQERKRKKKKRDKKQESTEMEQENVNTLP